MVQVNSPLFNQAQATGEGNASVRDAVLEQYGTFRAQLSNIVESFLDEALPLQVGNYVFNSEEKHGTAATFALNNWYSEQEYIFSQLLAPIQFEQKLDNMLNNLFT